MMRWIGMFIIILSLAGCGGKAQQHPWGTLKECEDQNTELSLQVQALQTQNDQLTEQVTTLSALDKNTRLSALDTLEKVRIGKYTGFYDTDENGTKESLVVYLEPLDAAQDTVKAPGQVIIELWNLNAPENDAKLMEWTVNPEQLFTTWGGTIFHSYYRIALPLEITVQPQTEYTLKITFTDYLGGKVLSDQKTVIATGRILD